LRVFMDNDVNLMTLAEARIGAAKGAKNAFCLTLGTGVGGGIIYEGRLHRGISFSAGEIGHIPLGIKGPKCNCGGSACLESYVGNRFILKLAKKKLGRRARNLTLEKLSKLAKRGNTIALDIFYDYAQKLGLALTAVINLLNPEVIAIGGGVSKAGGFLFAKIREVVKDRAMPIPAKVAKIKKAKLGNNAGILGAAILVKESL